MRLLYRTGVLFSTPPIEQAHVQPMPTWKYVEVCKTRISLLFRERFIHTIPPRFQYISDRLVQFFIIFKRIHRNKSKGVFIQVHPDVLGTVIHDIQYNCLGLLINILPHDGQSLQCFGNVLGFLYRLPDRCKHRRCFFIHNKQPPFLLI